MDLKEAYRRSQYGYKVAEEDRVRRLRALSHDDWLITLRNVHAVGEPDRFLFRAALEVQRGLRERGLTFCFIGGVALQRWGEVRQTSDIDLTVICRLGEERRTIEKLQEVIPSRVEGAEQLALEGRMYLGRSSARIEVDVSMGFTPYEHRLMERAVDVEFGVEEALHCCSGEDLVILKTVANRGQDWVDIGRIIQRSGSHLRWDLVFEEIGPLLELTDTPESEGRLRNLVDSDT